jgi:hypothetical protein
MEQNLCSIPFRSTLFHYVSFRSIPFCTINPNIALVNKLPPLEVVVSFETKLSLLLCPHHYHLKDTSLCRNDLVPWWLLRQPSTLHFTSLLSGFSHLVAQLRSLTSADRLHDNNHTSLLFFQLHRLHCKTRVVCKLNLYWRARVHVVPRFLFQIHHIVTVNIYKLCYDKRSNISKKRETKPSTTSNLSRWNSTTQLQPIPPPPCYTQKEYVIHFQKIPHHEHNEPSNAPLPFVAILLLGGTLQIMCRIVGFQNICCW